MGFHDHDEGDEVEIEYDRRVTETDLAVLYVIEGDEVWLPKSVHEEDEDAGVLLVREWFAEKEGLV